MGRISRRGFVAVATGAAAAPLRFVQARQPAALTARDVVGRIERELGLPSTTGSDGFKAGRPALPVKRIVTTAMASVDVLRRAAGAGATLIVTAEPTFYGRADEPASARGRAETDPVVDAKLRIIDEHDLVVWRLGDGWRQRRPEPFAQGLADALGWSRFWRAGDPTRVSIPAIRLDALASHVAHRLNARGGLRVVGSPTLHVERVGLLPGTTPIGAALELLPRVDAIVAGEVREWETVEYVRDAVTAGAGKALILTGRLLSRDPGMSLCARWLRDLVPELPTTWVPVGDPYWRPL